MRHRFTTLCLAAVAWSVNVMAQGPSVPEGFQMPQPTPNDTLTSTQVHSDGSVTFRIYAPEAKSVKLGGDLGGWGIPATQFVKADNGVWEATLNDGRIGSFRYFFEVDGVKVNDPKRRETEQLRPLIDVDPQDTAFWAMKDVPHGAVSQVYYPSKTFNCTRRMHIWTPAGYGTTITEKLPVFYLIHGGGDSDWAWPNVGKANFILDNLLAEGKMVPMIVVMPDGNVDVDKFTDDVMKDIIPYVEQNYNVLTDAAHRALAGLSMGGLETLDISLNNYTSFAYVCPMSTGWFLNSPFYAKWEPYLKEHAEAMNKSFKLYRFYMGGEEDIAYHNCIGTREAFSRYGIRHEYSSMPGGHSWMVWRYNLLDIAPRLFR